MKGTDEISEIFEFQRDYIVTYKEGDECKTFRGEYFKFSKGMVIFFVEAYCVEFEYYNKIAVKFKDIITTVDCPMNMRDY